MAKRDRNVKTTEQPQPGGQMLVVDLGDAAFVHGFLENFEIRIKHVVFFPVAFVERGVSTYHLYYTYK